MTNKPRKINPNLTKEQEEILFNQGTEVPFTGKYLNHDEKGIYKCINCGTFLFQSDSKEESSIPTLLGWPSFAEVAQSDAVELKDDYSFGMHRVEINCKNCGGHLGHVFDDDSISSGKHYCVNSACLAFQPADKSK